MKKILICIPTYSTVETETIKSLWDMRKPADTQVDLEFIKGYVVSIARNKLVELAIKGEYDYTLWIDSDIIVPDYLLEHLYQIIESGRADMATGYYIKKLEGQNITELFCGTDDNPNAYANVLESNLPKVYSICPVNASGFGCILIKTSIFKQLREKYPNNLCFEYVQNINTLCSEDIFFLARCKEQGLKLVVDTSCRCGHIGQKIY